MKVRCSYSPKQLVTIRDFAKEKMVVHSGPFGVGKTRCLVEAFGIYCAKLQELGTTGLTFVLAGKTQQAVKRNMCNVLSKQFGRDFRYFKGNGDGMDRDAVLFGQNIYLIGFNDSSSREKFQGISDIMGILHDECTLCSQEQFDYAHGRLRGEVNVEGEDIDSEDEESEFIDIDDSFGINLNTIRVPEGTVPMWYVGSCNPDAPNHFIKQYIDEGILSNVEWYMRDAIWKGATEYYEKLRRQYLGNPAFLARYLKGKWTSADRMIYCMFNPKVHVLRSDEFDISYGSFKRNFLGVDYGSDHPTGITLNSLNHQGVYITSKEWKLRNTAPSDIAQKVAEAMDYIVEMGSYCDAVYVDPSAKALKDELTKRGIHWTNALNSHADGIGHMQTLMSTGRYYVMDYCQELIGEIYSYHYVDSTSGEDKIHKLDDDLVDSVRYGIYSDYAIRG